MAELQASYIQASSHPADTDRLVLEGLMNPAGAPVSGAAYGVGRSANDLKVQAAGTPNMTVDILSGHAWIDGTEAANQGAYHVYNDATKNLVISAAHATLARKDLVVAKVQDAAYSGAVNVWSLAVVTGTPAGSPAEPAVPANAIVLALVDVAAAATSITNGVITDRRRRASALGGVTICTSATRPAAPYPGQTIYETDTDRVLVWDGSAWLQLGLKFDPPTCRAFHNTTQSIPNASPTTLLLNTDGEDPDGMHDPVTNNSRITISRTGRYSIVGHTGIAAAADYTLIQLMLMVNGSVQYRQTIGSVTINNQAPELSLPFMPKLTAGQYVEMLFVHYNGAAAARNVSGSELTVVWLGRA